MQVADLMSSLSGLSGLPGKSGTLPQVPPGTGQQSFLPLLSLGRSPLVGPLEPDGATGHNLAGEDPVGEDLRALFAALLSGWLSLPQPLLPAAAAEGAEARPLQAGWSSLSQPLQPATIAQLLPAGASQSPVHETAKTKLASEALETLDKEKLWIFQNLSNLFELLQKTAAVPVVLSPGAIPPIENRGIEVPMIQPRPAVPVETAVSAGEAPVHQAPRLPAVPPLPVFTLEAGLRQVDSELKAADLEPLAPPVSTVAAEPEPPAGPVVEWETRSALPVDPGRDYPGAWRESPSPAPNVEQKLTTASPAPNVEQKLTTASPAPNVEQKLTTAKPAPNVEQKLTTAKPAPPTTAEPSDRGIKAAEPVRLAPQQAVESGEQAAAARNTAGPEGGRPSPIESSPPPSLWPAHTRPEAGYGEMATGETAPRTPPPATANETGAGDARPSAQPPAPWGRPASRATGQSPEMASLAVSRVLEPESTQATGAGKHSLDPAAAVAPESVRSPAESAEAPRSFKLQPQAPAEAQLGQLLEMASLRTTPRSSQVQLLLHPENLGRLAVRLIERGGSVEVAMRSDSQTLRTLLSDSLPSLVERLNERGWDVSRLDRGSHEGGPNWWTAEQQARQGGENRHPPRQEQRGQPSRQGQQQAVFSLEF